MKHVIVLVAMVVTSLSCFGQAYEWKLKKEVDDIQVYFRKSPDSKINELKIETTVEASLSGIVTLLRDVPTYPSWVYKCEAAKRLTTLSDHEGIYYSEMNFPWPMANRDFIAYSHTQQDPVTKSIIIEARGRPEYIPEKEGLVRIPHIYVRWKITPTKPGEAKISYFLQSDPGGSIPPWIINMAIDQGPTNSIKNLREMLSNEKYQNAQLSFIQELD